MLEIVECIKSEGKEIYLKNGSLYTVIFSVIIGETTFYRLKEIMNLLFEDWRFKPADKPGYSMPVMSLGYLTDPDIEAINDNEEERQRLAA